MQMAKEMAQRSGYKSSPFSSSFNKRATNMALAQRDSWWSSYGGGASKSIMVFLVRKTHQGKQIMGKYDPTTDDNGDRTLHAKRIGSSEVTGLSTAEEFLIYRRRNNLSQRQVASKMGIHRNTYGRFEAGKYVDFILFCPQILHLDQHEICFLYRRRLGLTQQVCADDMGVTRFWYNLMENGKVNSNTLLEYWNER